MTKKSEAIAILQRLRGAAEVDADNSIRKACFLPDGAPISEMQELRFRALRSKAASQAYQRAEILVGEITNLT